MDRFFGFDKPALDEQGISLFATLYDDISLQMYEELLKAAEIPYLKKDRAGGGAMRILMGNNPQGTDIFVADAHLNKARELLALDDETAESAEEDA